MNKEMYVDKKEKLYEGKAKIVYETENPIRMMPQRLMD